MSNQNHPVRDSQIKVDPIKSITDIKSIKKLLKDNIWIMLYLSSE